MTNSTDHPGWRPLPAPGPVITLLSTSWQRSRWRRDFRWPQGRVLTAAWLPPRAQAQGDQGAKRARWGQFPQGPSQTQRVLGVGEGPGCPSGQGWEEAEILVHGVGQGGLLSPRVPGGARR